MSRVKSILGTLRDMGYSDIQIFDCVQELMEKGELYFCDRCLMIYSSSEKHKCKEGC